MLQFISISHHLSLHHEASKSVFRVTVAVHQWAPLAAPFCVERHVNSRRITDCDAANAAAVHEIVTCSTKYQMAVTPEL